MYGRNGRDQPTYDVVMVLTDSIELLLVEDCLYRRYKELAIKAGTEGTIISGNNSYTYIPPHRIKVIHAEPTGDTTFASNG